ncbi:MAG: multidrug resistance protein [Gemmatimonadetes bacterium]|jgi:MFS family permease|nr:multidrug resistance protein [Gemmatimonadota bacterium]
MSGAAAGGDRDRGKKLWVLMTTAFLDMVGLLMVIPLLPFYATSLGQGGAVVGMLMSSFAVAQLVTAPMWGRMSDSYGRRPALLVGLGASVIAYVIFAWALQLPHPLFFLFLSRLVQGAGGGTVGVIQAYVADSTTPDERAKALGWLSAATNAGVVLGPVLGSLTLAWGPQGPGMFAAGLCLLNMVFAWKYLHESRDMHEAAVSKANTAGRPRSRDAIAHVLTHSGEPASRLIWIYAIAMGAFQGVTTMLALYLSQRFGVTARTIGFFFAYTGVISVLTRALILSRMVDRYGEARLSRIGSVLLATGIFAMAFTKPIADPARVAALLGNMLPAAGVAALPYVPLALAVALLPLGTAFTFPCVTAMLSRVIESRDRGLYMGVQQSFGGVARVLFPVLFGYLFDWHLPVPFLLAAALVGVTVYLGWGIESHVKARATA